MCVFVCVWLNENEKDNLENQIDMLCQRSWHYQNTNDFYYQK